jgi:hypothetical protein
VSDERTAREVVEGLTTGFAAVHPNQVREALETHGVEIDWVTVGIWTVRDGRLVGMHNFLTRADALAALKKGLP